MLQKLEISRSRVASPVFRDDGLSIQSGCILVTRVDNEENPGASYPRTNPKCGRELCTSNIDWLVVLGGTMGVLGGVLLHILLI